MEYTQAAVENVTTAYVQSEDDFATLYQSIESIIHRIASAGTIERFLTSKGISLDTFTSEVLLSSPTTKQRTLTIEQCRSIVNGTHDNNWKGPGFCPMYFSRSTSGPHHTHCSNLLSHDEYVCSQCYAQPEGKSLSDKFASGVLSEEHYREQKEQLRMTAAKNKMRCADEILIKFPSKKSRGQVKGTKYEHRRGHGYYRGLVVQQRVVRGVNILIAVGIDERNDGNIRKISLSDAPLIKDLGVQLLDENLDDSARKYFNINYGV